VRALARLHQTGGCRSKSSHGRYPNLIRYLPLIDPDQVWLGDITYLRLRLRFLYLAVILDGYTRAVRGWVFDTRSIRRSP
jgi:putative transposase